MGLRQDRDQESGRSVDEEQSFGQDEIIMALRQFRDEIDDVRRQHESALRKIGRLKVELDKQVQENAKLETALADQQAKTALLKQVVNEVKARETTQAADMADIRKEIKRVGNSAEVGGAINIYNETFGSPGDILTWIGDPEFDYGIFHDASSVVHSITPGSMTHKSALTCLMATSDAKMRSELEGKVVTSFSARLPYILLLPNVNANAASDQVPDKHLKVKSAWRGKSKQEGLAPALLNGAREVSRQVGATIMALWSHPIRMFAHSKLNTSLKFINELVTFIVLWVLELEEGFSDKQIWELMGTILKVVFEELHEARSLHPAVSNNDYSVLLWGMCRAHIRMNTFLSFRFRDDPAITAVLVAFMMNSGPSTELLKRMAAAEKNSTQANTTANSIKACVTALEAKVK